MNVEIRMQSRHDPQVFELRPDVNWIGTVGAPKTVEVVRIGMSVRDGVTWMLVDFNDTDISQMLFNAANGALGDYVKVS